MTISLITGGSGLVGQSLIRRLKKNWYSPDHMSVDYSDKIRTEKFFNELMYWFKEVDKNNYEAEYEDFVVYNFAAKVGGIRANMNGLAEFFETNMLINMNVLKSAHKHKDRIKKVLSLTSTCTYPDDAPKPLKEENLHDGPPHNSNYGYAYSKRMVDILSKCYRDEYGCNFIVAIPTNIFGPNDQYDLENSHVIPGIIHKVFLAKKENKKSIELWGTGEELRDFIFVDDLTRALVLLMEKYNEREPINIASGKEVSIKYVAEKICEYLKFNGNIKWSHKMSGQFRKPVDTSKIKSLGWRPSTSIDKGLKISCEWFAKNYPNVRGAIID